MKSLSDVITLASEDFSKEAYRFLEDTIYTMPLSAAEQGDLRRLLNFTRKLQKEDVAFESLYHRLLHLYVLNGSRLDQLQSVDRRLRGLADGQGALLLVGGVSGIGKTTLVMAFQERIARLGARLLFGRCSDHQQMDTCCFHSEILSI